MKCLSLWEPHATAIAIGLKPYETRAWQLPTWAIERPVAIHAARNVFRERDYDYAWFKETKQRLSVVGVRLEDLAYGKIVCVVWFAGWERTVKVAPRLSPDELFWGDFRNIGDDGKRRFAFKVQHVNPIPKDARPAVLGRQGFFNVPDELVEQWSKRNVS